jgi:hypothetical protein
MAIPDQNDVTGYPIENLLKEDDYLFTCETMPIRTDTQTNSFAFRRDQQRSQQVETLVMIDGCPLNRCLASPRPSSVKRRDKGKTAFIFQNEGSAQLATLFLSLAVPLSSTAQWLPHFDATVGVAVVGCSNPSAASHARQHWSHSERQIVARSPEQSDPGSSSLRYTQRHKLLCPALSPAVSSACQTICWDDLASDLFSSFWLFGLCLPAIHGALCDLQNFCHFFRCFSFGEQCETTGSSFCKLFVGSFSSHVPIMTHLRHLFFKYQ